MIPAGVEQIHELPSAPARPQDAHKGTFGSALIIAGSEGMSGAARLAGQAALHGGAGLVTVAIPRSVAAIVAVDHPSYMTLRLAEDDAGRVTAGAIPAIDKSLDRQTAVAIGPGLGQSKGVSDVVQHLYRHCALPLVVDADGLNGLSSKPTTIQGRAITAQRILTPHPGEFSRLTGLETIAIQAARQQHAVEFAATHDVVLLLKGAGTVITDGRRIAITSTGGPGLATGGSGDVLTGLIVSLLAQGMSGFAAAQLGAHLHGIAGEIAAQRYTDRFATSVELLRCLDQAWTQLLASQ
jgi:ADP-dependent NAD(P)H-hydrate dehydratase